MKRKLLKSLLTGAFVMGAIFMATSFDANAQVRQTKATKSSVTVSWDKIEGADRYTVELCKDSNFKSGTYSESYPTTGTKKAVYGLDAGSTYFARVTALEKTPTGYKNLFTEMSIPVVTAPEKNTTTSAPKITQVTATEKSIAFSWDKIAGATEYDIEFCKNGGTMVPIDSTTKTTYRIDGLEANTLYDVKITPKRSCSGNEFVATGSAIKKTALKTLPGKNTTLKVSSFSNEKVSYGFTKSKTSTGFEYRIYVGKNKKGNAVFLTGSSKKTVSSNKLKNAQIYYVQIREYIKDSDGKNVYSKWSNKAYFGAVDKDTVKITKNRDNRMIVSWKKVSGANGYNVYVSKKMNGKYKYVGTKKQGKYKLNTCVNVSKGGSYYVRIVPYKTIDGKKVEMPSKSTSYTASQYFHKN